MPGGGAGLAVQTAQDFIGVPINYYAQIDFDAFVQFIDEIGGVDINVPAKIKVSVMGGYEVKSNSGKTYIREEKVFKTRMQTLDGATALAYARHRHTDGGDYDRARRQQQVVDAVRDQSARFQHAANLNHKSTQALC